MKKKKMTLRNQIFFILLLLIAVILALVYLTFLAATNHSNALSMMELSAHIKSTLFRILLLAVAISAFLSFKVAESISKPIRDLSLMAEELSHLEFSPKDISTNSLEISILNNKLNTMAKQLNSYYCERNSLLQNISHELKTPLMSIHGYAEAVREGIEEDVDSAMTIIMEESQNLTRMVNQLLILSKRDAFIGQPDHANLTVAQEIPAILKTLEGIALQNKITLTYHLEREDLICRISADVLRIALSNLLSNSLRYAKTMVHLSLTQENGFAVFTILDDGGGIKPDQLSHIFERNFTGTGGMYGLGLHIVQKTLESVSGHISVCNVEGGSCFTVALPLVNHESKTESSQ